jgi:hypothetical protein
MIILNWLNTFFDDNCSMVNVQFKMTINIKHIIKEKN